MDEQEIKNYLTHSLKDNKDELFRLHEAKKDLLQYKNELESKYYKIENYEEKVKNTKEKINNCSWLLLFLSIGGSAFCSKYNTNIQSIDTFFKNNLLNAGLEMFLVWQIIFSDVLAKKAIDMKYSKEVKKHAHTNRLIEEDLDMLNINLNDVESAIFKTNVEISKLREFSEFFDEIKAKYYGDDKTLGRKLK